MSADSRGIGLSVTRILIGVIFVFEGLGKVRWLSDPSILAVRFSRWLESVGLDSLSGRYLGMDSHSGNRCLCPIGAAGGVVFGRGTRSWYGTPSLRFSPSS